MSTKTKSTAEVVLVLSDEERDTLIDEYTSKYHDFKEINSILVASMLRDIVVPKNSSIEHIKLILDREILTYLCILIRNLDREEILEEILIHYSTMLDSILLKLGFTENIDELKKKILKELVNDYVGQADFINMYARYATGYIKHILSKSEINKIISEYASTFYANKIEDISLVGNHLNILHEIDLDNPNFVKFVILKFGYNGYYLDDHSIKNILSLTDDEYNEFMDRALKTMSRASKIDNSQKVIIK